MAGDRVVARLDGSALEAAAKVDVARAKEIKREMDVVGRLMAAAPALFGALTLGWLEGAFEGMPVVAREVELALGLVKDRG